MTAGNKATLPWQGCSSQAIMDKKATPGGGAAIVLSGGKSEMKREQGCCGDCVSW